ncbi:MAG TPA: IPT/TIG domain-containing protein [Terriglobia bacterium]|nr:IPT/TIG domain-containing protein [Terriglobia bacterium]
MSLWKKTSKAQEVMQKPGPAPKRPAITEVAPKAAISGGEITIRGSGFTENGNAPPLVRFGGREASLLMSSPSRIVARVPDGAVSGDLTVETSAATSAPAAIAVGAMIAENVHPVANPAVDAEGNVFTTLSGSRGQKTPVSIYKISPAGDVSPFLMDIVNPTGLAFDREGLLCVSSRADGTIYQVTPAGRRSTYAEGMGIATGIAFDRAGDLYVGDRSGTIFKINHARQIFVFATIEPSVAAYHLAFGPDGCLYVTGPTTSSFDQIYRISPHGEVSPFYRGLGRPQGLAFDAHRNLYVAASLAGRRGVIRITPGGEGSLAVSGQGLVGLAFSGHRSMVLASSTALYRLDAGIEGLRLPVE